jgi:hypothetical protein
MLVVPSVDALAVWSGRSAVSYSGFASSALLQATLMFTTVTELQPSDFGSLSPDDQVLATQGILAMADYIYLRQPYQQVIAAPFTSETVGSYSYGKAQAESARNAAALEVQGERTGVTLYDMAVQYLAKRLRAGGVTFGQVTVFEEGSLRYDGAEVLVRDEDGRMVLVGPADHDQFDMPFDRNTEVFPQDPGIA